MCGNIGIFGKSITDDSREIFLQMLDTGKVRGRDATGMAAVFKDKTVKIVKDNVDGAKFVDLNEYKINQAMEGSLQGLIGHNRLATMGANTVANAHPFNHGPIYGIHNGVVRKQELKNLPTQSNHEVDSDQLYKSIHESGLDRTMGSIDADWALIWYNSEDDRFYFLRNGGRPLWYRYSEDKKLLYVLSEPAMGNWLINRMANLDKDGWHPFKIDMLYSLDANQWTVELKEEREVKGREVTYLPRQQQSNWWEQSGQVRNVVPFKPKPKPLMIIPMKFSEIEDTPIFTIEEIREMKASQIDDLYDRAMQSKGLLKTNIALDCIFLAEHNWSGKMTWRPSHQAQVLAAFKGIAAQQEKLEVLEKYIRILDGQKLRHKLFPVPAKPIADIKIGAAIEYDVEEQNGDETTVHTLTVLPTTNTLDFNNTIETLPNEHLEMFVGPGFDIIPTNDLSGTLVLDWTKGMNKDDVDHVETCKNIHKWLTFFVMPGLKHNFPSDRRDGYIDNFEKSCVVKSYGMDWKAPSSMWTTKSMTRKSVFVLSKKAVEFGLRKTYMNPFVYQEKLLQIKPYLKEAA